MELIKLLFIIVFIIIIDFHAPIPSAVSLFPSSVYKKPLIQKCFIRDYCSIDAVVVFNWSEFCVRPRSQNTNLYTILVAIKMCACARAFVRYVEISSCL